MKIITTLLIMVAFYCAGTVAIFAAERPQRVKSLASPPADPATIPAPTAAPTPAPAILSIIPAQAEPGGKVMMFGSGFGTQANAYLGSVEIPTRITDGKQVGKRHLPDRAQPDILVLQIPFCRMAFDHALQAGNDVS